ncbi:MAG TPA: hypothetical protein VFD46_14185 [Chryseolinea sp.]|nr:hypothetical protein [Chryseolinea sp.]
MNKKPSKTQTITVKVNEENPEPLELIAKSIIEVAEAFQKIEASQLRRHTVVLLIQAQTKISQKDINSVLDCAVKLKSIYLKSEVKK